MSSRSFLGNHLKKIGWMAALWLISVLALGVFAFAFRLLMSSAGLTVG